ncbi:hypothetical protein LEP1GSC082_2917 [Leptospira kirschneri str. H2]|uniref:Uncharacterized protein n=1 Tax=Leptospira kirschneri serovar Bulgarica str. Nikolaevo TaxID=1240687 RepID=M6FTZ5_9LEPT|nr:hypothetical protein LEP1GSC082_2917 [Leptospira kirschneri str. H2]EMK26251.1 hypothetical protein LEP1GSC008_0986 [Leptospira kirschneri serovar Bulgarica str. Nikolaevo]
MNERIETYQSVLAKYILRKTFFNSKESYRRDNFAGIIFKITFNRFSFRLCQILILGKALNANEIENKSVYVFLN